MPIYEYQCQDCGAVTDFLQKMSDAPMVTCPECKSDALKKLVSAPRFRLAGNGWYETDFKQGDKRNLVSSDSTSSSSPIKSEKTSDQNSTSSNANVKSQTGSDGGKAA